jgi:A/G-specific adenine glycosylase
VLRDSTHPVTTVALDASWHDTDQRARALEGLLADGLVEAVAGGYRLPT